MVENWTFSLFFCVAEMWGAVVISVLFWTLANEVTPCLTTCAASQGAAMHILGVHTQRGQNHLTLIAAVRPAFATPLLSLPSRAPAQTVLSSNAPKGRNSTGTNVACEWARAVPRGSDLGVRQVCTVAEAKAIYPLMGIAANVALVAAGNLMKAVNLALKVAGPSLPAYWHATCVRTVGTASAGARHQGCQHTIVASCRQ